MGESGVELCLTFDYGQLAAEKEILAAAALAGHYQLSHKVVKLPFLREITDNALVCGDVSLPEPDPADLDDPEAAAVIAANVWIPNRNGLFINIAAAFAEACGAGLIAAGFNREEAVTFPDNSEGFVRAVNNCLEYSVREQMKAVSYTQRLDKVDIVKLGKRLSVPFQYIWSCYRGGETMCGKCESCRRLIRAAQLAGLSLSEFRFA
jgi:7-cyano-7-deazaguanine synthase